MGEIKSVKVDNWGVFFLQKLQNFFNKTDYCDLTLQFNDNSQLKVHRLVLNACTDYFNILEQTCEMIEDVLIMPPGLQADVVVPIVNFMYTGTLEFELKMYGRLLKTAKDMNMTVLLKLLEAHRRTMEGNKTQTLNKITPKTPLRRIQYTPTTGRIIEDRTYSNQSTSTTTPPRRAQNAHSTQHYKTLQIKPVAQNIFPRSLPEPAQIMTKFPHTKTPVKGPSRFDCNEDTLPPETFEKSFDNISYESKPLICKEEADAYDYDNLIRKHETYASPFEQLRRGYTNNSNNKRPASSVSSYESPPEKKPNIEDVKEYAEQQRMRKQIAEEFDDDQEYDEVLDDEIHNDDDDDEYVPPHFIRKQVKQFQQQTVQVKVNQTQKSGKQDGGTRPTIVVKDSTSTNVNHAKIISEVLRKYPHLVKNNKNIKLKIMPQSNNAQKIVIKKESAEVGESSSFLEETKPHATITIPSKQSTSPIASTSTQAVQAAAIQPRRIDSKTMHALIALGAENRTGPWLCLRCGVNGRPISIPSYRGFRRHLVNAHKEKIDPRLCEHCGWRSANNKELAYHLLVEHSVKATAQYTFPKCEICGNVFIDYDALNMHQDEKHPIKKEKQTCIYCNRSFTEELHLYTHMKAFHKERAIEDGVLDFSDEEDSFGKDQQLQDSKIKIISDISLPKNVPIIHAGGIPATATTLGLDHTDTTTDLRVIESTASDDAHLMTSEYMGTDSSSQGPKFVNADGNEMMLTPAQREEIISQLDQQHDGIVMVLNQEPFEPAAAVESTADNAATVATEQVGENSMFIVCGQEAETVSEQSMPATMEKEESSNKSKDPLEWGGDDANSDTENTEKDKKNDENENEIDRNKSNIGDEDADKSVDESADADTSKDVEEKEKSSSNKSEVKTPSKDSLEMKLKLLTDWTDDEDDDEEEEVVGEEEDTEKFESELDTSKEEEVNERDTSKEEILFETIASVENTDPVKDEFEEKTKDEDEEIEKETEAEKVENQHREEEEEVEQMKISSSACNENEEDDDDGDDEKPDCATPANEDNKAEKEDERSEEVTSAKEAQDDKTTGKESPKIEEEEDDVAAADSIKSEEKENPNLITKAELRNIMSDWVDDDDDDDDDEM